VPGVRGGTAVRGAEAVVRRGWAGRVFRLVRARWLPVHLVLGAVIALVFAWIVGLQAPAEKTGTIFQQEQDAWLVLSTSDRWRDYVFVTRVSPSSVDEHYARLIEYTMSKQIPPNTPRIWEEYESLSQSARSELYGSVDRAGWPMRCVERELVMLRRTKQTILDRGTLRLATIHFPIAPVFPGAVVNVLFFATVIWWLHAGVNAVEREWRRNYARLSGTCHVCGYQRKGLADGAVCPECGAGPP
jgi:hypothetical protein